MRRLVPGLVTFALILVLGPTPASAQKFFVGAGVTVPSGDFGDYAKTGWMVNGGFAPWRSADNRATIWAEGLFGSNSFEGAGDNSSNLYGGLGSFTYNVTGEASAVPYVIGSVGYLMQSFESGTNSDSEGGLAFGGGAGIGIQRFYLEARYLTASIQESTTAFLQFSAGITF